MTKSKPLVVIVAGQTASGKSMVCQALASRLCGEIISMDAIKVYRGMDIGSAKASTAERESTPHHLLDLVDASEAYSVGRYVEVLEATVKDCHAREVLPIIDCGTPMYLQAFLSGILDAPEPDIELRAALEERGTAALMQELATLDPVSAERLHANDRKRIIRALEYALQSGEPISARQNHFDQIREDFRIIMTGPLWAGETLRPRINQRIQKMLDAGLVNEVKAIRDGQGFSQSAEAAIGYRQILDYLAGECSLEEAVTKMENRTWNLARKQLMWFKRHDGMKWIRVSSEEELRRAAIFLVSEVLDEWKPEEHGIPIGMPE